MPILPSLEIRSHPGGDLPDQLDGRLVFQGEQNWRFRGPADELREIGNALGSVVRWIHDEVFLLNWGNTVGYLRLPRLGLEARPKSRS